MTAFEEIFRAYNKKVYNLCLLYVQDADDAKDLTQDVFIRIHKSMNSFREEASLQTWVYRIAVNLALDHLKKKKRRAVFLGLFQIFVQNNAQENNRDFNPGIAFEHLESMTQLMHAMEKLPKNQKMALLLSKWEGLPQSEIAETMKLSEKAVESLLQRAKSNLKKYLNHE